MARAQSLYHASKLSLGAPAGCIPFLCSTSVFLLMLCCAQYLIDKYFPKLSCSVHPAEVSRIKLSYVKRRMPVLLTGRFPLLSGRVPNTVLVKGYVGEYLVVNDPRGNANSRYVDRYGENMIYSCENLHDWTCVDGSAYLLRVIPTGSSQPQSQAAGTSQ